jgi:Carboxypeptidase regulatory-like domain
MLARRVLLVAALTLFALQADALPVHVALNWPAGMPTSTLAHVHIHAVRMAGYTDNPVPLEAEVPMNGMVLNLGDGVWQVQASAPGYWSQETEVAVARSAPASVRLALWPAASLHGEIATAAGEPLPDDLEVRLSATSVSVGEADVPQAPIARPALGPSHAELHCRIAAGTWSCLGPAGLFDVRLEAAEYAPRYEWSVSLKAAESTDLGRTVLRKTASVFGRAVRKDGSNPPGPCMAALQVDAERGAPDHDPDTQSAPVGKTSFVVPLSRRGYFQMIGVSPGRYMLLVECMAASGVRELRVQADSETRINPPLLLGELPLNIIVTPRVDPEGRPWQLIVDETAPHFLRIADKATTSPDGRWLRRGLTAGQYRVTVKSSDGTSWLQQYFNLRASSGPLSLRLASVKVAGRVQLSSQPVRARLVFFNNNADGESAALKSDDDGRFQGLLPVRPGVQETNWTVDAHVAQPPINQRLLNVSVQPVGGGARTWLDLNLPTIAVRGSVISEDGHPQRGIQVTFKDVSGIRTTTSTDHAGRFEMPDLPPGKYTAVADSPEGSSDRTPFEVVAGRESELKLVLNPFERVPFSVVSDQGPVLNAAVQVWIKPGVPQAFVHTDQDGRFEVSLPPGITDVGLTIGAPGYAIKLTRLKISSEANESPDANTITLDDSGGTLVLNFQPPGSTLDSSGTLYLVHNGAIQDARTIVGWGTNQAGPSGNGPAVVNAIEPGKYALCRADPAKTAILWSGPLPENRCQTGSVEQGETLTLSPR